MNNIEIVNNNSHRTLLCWGRKLYVDYDEDNKYKKYNKILLKDPNDYAFLFGIPEYPSIDLLINYINQILENNGWLLENTISVGYSGGGFSAILYGNLMNVPEIKVCCPTTKIDFNFENNILLEKRFNKNQNDFRNKFSEINPSYLDLKNLNFDKTKLYIYYTNENKYDIINSNNLKDKSNVILKEYNGLNHFGMKKFFDVILYES